MVHLRGILGRSFVFLKPRKDGHSIKFRNEHVSFATPSEAINDNFGSDTPPKRRSTTCTARALIYLREDTLDELLYFV